MTIHEHSSVYVTANTSLLAKVVPQEPDVVLAMFTDPIKHFARPFPVCYVGLSNYQCSLACQRFFRQDQMETWQATPTNAVGTSTAGPSMAGPSSAGTQSAPNRQAKRKQWANQTEPCSVTVGFRGTAVQIASLADPPLPIVCAILWEPAELSFQSDLLTLDKALIPELWEVPNHETQYLAIFLSEVIGRTWDTPLPQQHEGLFWGTLNNLRALGFADVFRILLSAWPSLPQGINEPLLVSTPQNKLQKKVNMLMEFYVQMFFYSTGRPPIVPRRYPGSWVA
ncbi:hypothetical protein PAXINDRAFT_15526 [Paxillus involutus ATCC 200175]|uniref:Uncharacterized protein n=1 Tax=Paxillus involutus ATCC 200175 TaxID=664439 RepID=A0A0C9TWF3_PAXIN|nr:hypothetical protein PAXINDRAFT_15526 [Paxillus involutus ATCC 200175]